MFPKGGNNLASYIIAVAVGVIALAADQYTKYLAELYVPMTGQGIDFIPGIVGFWRTNNGGAAWGFLEGHTWLLLSVTVVIMIICVAMLLKYGLTNKLLFWALTLVLSGGIGNLIDRIFNGGVVIDFLHLHFMPDFPVFNIADCAVVIGALLLILELIIDMVTDRQKAIAESDKKEN